MTECCRWYDTNIKYGQAELTCDITDEETSCCGDTGRCECEQLRQEQLEVEATDIKSDADRENNYSREYLGRGKRND